MMRLSRPKTHQLNVASLRTLGKAALVLAVCRDFSSEVVLNLTLG